MLIVPHFDLCHAPSRTPDLESRGLFANFAVMKEEAGSLLHFIKDLLKHLKNSP